MAKTQTLPWHAAEHLETEEDMAIYLEAALEENDPALVAPPPWGISPRQSMTQITREAGLGRESLYKALSPQEGNPRVRDGAQGMKHFDFTR